MEPHRSWAPNPSDGDGSCQLDSPLASGGLAIGLMTSELSPKRFFQYPLRIAGVLVLAALGPLFWLLPIGNGIQRLSYDLPFVWRGRIATPEVVIVYLDEASAAALGQRVSDVWDRSLHTRLLNRLTRDGATGRLGGGGTADLRHRTSEGGSCVHATGIFRDFHSLP